MAKNLEYKSIELKQETTSRMPDGRLKVVAYAAVFGNVDSYNDIIVKGAFKSSLKKEGHRVGYLIKIRQLVYHASVLFPIQEGLALRSFGVDQCE